MQLPLQLPKNQEDRRILGEFYDTFNRAQWFIRAEFFENHPTQMRRTIEAYVGYVPTLEMKEVLSWLHKYQLGIEWKTVENTAVTTPR